MKVELDSFFKSLTPDYLQNRLSQIEELNQLLEEKNFEELKKCFHKIAGSGGGYGLSEVSVIAKRIEKSIQENNQEDIMQFFLEYKNLLNNIELIFKD